MAKLTKTIMLTADNEANFLQEIHEEINNEGKIDPLKKKKDLGEGKCVE